MANLLKLNFRSSSKPEISSKPKRVVTQQIRKPDNIIKIEVDAPFQEKRFDFPIRLRTVEKLALFFN